MSRAIVPSHTLAEALRASSPRFAPPRTPWASTLIHGSILVLWLVLLARAFGSKDLVAWSVGIVYIGYDTALLAFVAWQTRGLGRSLAENPAAAPGGAVSGPATLSVIVAAHNEAAVLPTTLEALFEQAEPPERILIADDGSTDGTAALLANRYGIDAPPIGTLSAPSPVQPSLQWLRLPHAGKPEALNSAFLHVDTELMLTVDADTLLDRQAIAAMRRAFAADGRLVAATGILTPLCGTSLSGRLFQWFQTYEYMRNFLSRYAWMQVDGLLLISGAFAAFRRAPVLAVGGFDPACLVEDYELIHRLRRHGVNHGLGWTTAVVGTSRAVTDAPGSVGAFLRQRRRWFGGFLQTQLWYRDMVGNRAYGALGLLMLPVKAADTLQPIYGLTAFAILVVSLLRGRFAEVNPIVGVIGLKLAVDVAFHLRAIQLYRGWAGPVGRVSLVSGLAAALVEPFCFQVLRHCGAAWGWVMFLTGNRTWGVQRRFALVTEAAAVPRDTPTPDR